MLKLPRNWNKFTNQEQREYAEKQVKEIRKLEEDWLKVTRKLADGKATVQIEERPDVEILKS